MNNQIEEMANIVHDADAKIIYDMVKAKPDDFVGRALPRQVYIAKALYAEGYRKASDVENAIYAVIEKDFSLAIERLKKAKLNLIGDMRIYADGKLSAYKSILSDLPRIIGLYKESEGADDD